MKKSSLPLLSSPTNEDELRHLLLLAAPLILSQVLEYLPNIFNGMLIGHLEPSGSSEARLLLAANGLGALYFTVFIYSAAIGVGTALDGLCSQAYGKGAIEEIGIVVQTAYIAAGMLFLPLAALCIFSNHILLLLGQSLEVANATQQYTLYMTGAIPFVFLYEIFKRVLQGQNIIIPIVIAFAIANAVNFIISYILLYYIKVGYIGCAIAFTFLYATGAFLLYYKVKQIKHLYDNSMSWDSIWKLMLTFMSLSFHGWAMFVFELAGVSVSSFLAGGLSNATVAITATSIYMGFRMIFSMPYLGLGIAASIRVGNALGAHKPLRAKTAAWKTLIMSVSWGILSGIAMITFGLSYAKFYTQDAEVLQLVNHLLWATAPLQITMAIWNIVQGVFRGSGTPHEGAKLNILGFFIVGLPLGYAMAYKWGFGLLGLWLGVYTGFGICSAYGLYWLATINWDYLIAKSRMLAINKGYAMGARCMSSSSWYKDGLAFTCTKCGNCCSGRAGSVRFTDEELTKMADKMKVTVAEFLTKYTRRQGRGDKSFYQLKELRKNQLDGFDCVFLSRQGKQTRCQLYEARPLQCRTWPFWPENTESKSSWKETSQTCPGVNKGSKHAPDEIEKQLQATINWRQSLTTSRPSRLVKPSAKSNST